MKVKISEILNSGRITISFEIFPPKADADYENVRSAAEKIAELRPDFISVTYGASGGTSKNTVGIASYIQNELHSTAIAHLTCVSSTKGEVARMLDQLAENKIENILALRGDIPKDHPFPIEGGYRYAYELIEEIKSRGDFCIGAACYPEGHIECPHKEDDINFLKQKVDSGVDFLTTQMFFDNNVLYSFLYRILRKNITVPVLAGIMPLTNSRQIKRSCELSGTTLPPRFAAIADKFSDNPKALKQAGIAYATEQIIDLIANGIRGIHIYTMNKPDVAASILHNISDIVGK